MYEQESEPIYPLDPLAPPLPLPPPTESIITQKEKFLVALTNWAIVAFLFITAVAWGLSGLGWPPLWLCVFALVIVLLIFGARWGLQFYIAELRAQKERDHQLTLRIQDSRDMVVQYGAPVHLQHAVNDGVFITKRYDYKTVELQTKAQFAERGAEDTQRELDRLAEYRRIDLDRTSADRHADLDRKMRKSLAILEGNQQLTMEMAQQVTEMIMLIHDLETEGLDREITRIIDSVENMRPAMEAIFNASGNPQAQATLLDLFMGAIMRGMHEMIGSYAKTVFQQRNSRRRPTHDSVPR